MPHRLVLALLAAALFGACAAPDSSRESVRLIRCDDGGSGGVVIDGVCL